MVPHVLDPQHLENAPQDEGQFEGKDPHVAGVCAVAARGYGHPAGEGADGGAARSMLYMCMMCTTRRRLVLCMQ